MADSQSLVLLPPQPAASPQSEQKGTQKAAKPSDDKSFGKKLDTAKKQIAAKTPDVKLVAVPVKNAGKAVASTPQDPATPGDANTEAPVDETTAKATEKLPVKVSRPVVKDPTDAESTDEDVATEAATKAAEPTPVKAVAPVKPKTDRPQKTAKVPDQKAAPVKEATPQPVVNQVAADQTSKVEDHSTDDAAPAKADATDATSPADSTDTVSSGNNALFGSGKVVGKGNPGDANSQTVNAAVNTADDQGTAEDSAADQDPVAAASTEIAATTEAPVEKTSTESDSHTPGVTTALTGLAAPTGGHTPAAIAGKTSASSTAASPQARFTDDNHPKIVTGIVGQLLPKGGTMQLQLNPADLGALQVTVHIQDGTISASFETSNDDATKLLSHSLGQLKTGLEAAGVSVEKLHVEQAPQKDASKDSSSESDSKSPLQDQQRQAQQDQQRKDMVQRMWRRLAGGSDPLDLVA